jgi:hypothetical protein
MQGPEHLRHDLNHRHLPCLLSASYNAVLDLDHSWIFDTPPVRPLLKLEDTGWCPGEFDAWGFHTWLVRHRGEIPDGSQGTLGTLRLLWYACWILFDLDGW